MANLVLILRRACDRAPDAVAVRLDDLALSYRRLDDLSGRVAGRLLAMGIKPGDRVAIMLPNTHEFPVLYYGALRAGACVVPMNPLLKSREIEHYLGDSDTRVLFAAASTRNEVERSSVAQGISTTFVDAETLTEVAGWDAHEGMVDRGDDDTAVILYTSGTTGTPKGAELTHRNMYSNATVMADQLFGLTSEDVVMGCLPLFHCFGQTCAMNAAIHVGGTLRLMPQFRPEDALALMEKDGVTLFVGVPSMYVALLQAGAGIADTSTLRLCASGGAPLPVEVLHGFVKTFEAEILEGYGLSETAPAASFNRRGEVRPGSVGVPIPGVEMRIEDEQGTVLEAGAIGEVCIRGDNVMKGYWNRPEATADAIRDGWFHSGDLGRQDEDGFFYVVDRTKDMVIRNGYNVYPREIEEVLYEHEDVVEAAVVGVPHPQYGEEIKAVVTLRPGSGLSTEELRDFVKDRIAAYKYPRIVEIVDELPKGPTGKILKRELRAAASTT